MSLSLISFSGFRTNLVLLLHALSPAPPPSVPFAQILSSPNPPPCPLFSFLSIYGKLPYPILSPRSLSPGVAGEIRGYYFLQSAESGPQHLTPSASTLTPTMAGGRGTPAVSVRSLPPFCLLHRWGHFHLSSDRGGRTNRRRGEEPLMRTKKRILILCVWDEMEREREEGRSGLGSEGTASEGRWGGGTEVKQRGTNKQSHSHPCTRMCTSLHITHWSNLPWIRRLSLLSFLECFLLHPLIRSAAIHPSPTLRKHWLFSVTVPGPRCPDPPDLPQLPLYKHSPVL